MPAYPTGIWAPTTKLGWRNILWAAHMNDLQAEVDSAQRIFGINPHRSNQLPGGLSHDYGTVEVRMTEHARGLALPFYRGMASNVTITPNAWQTIAFNPMADPYNLASADGTTVTLNETGWWLMTARAEYKATGYSLQKKAARMLRIMVGGQDIGLHDFTKESAKNSFALHNHVDWPDIMASGTTLSVQIRTDIDAPDHVMLANVAFRAYFIRTMSNVPEASKLRLMGGGA